KILTFDNNWMIGITQKPSSHEYYLVLYYDLHTVLDSFIQIEDVMCYSDFYEIKEIGSGCYGTVYTAKYKKYSEVWYMDDTFALKRFKSFDYDETPELFISEVSNNWQYTLY